jgi:tetratricopeptide (TPR) repeat protein
MRCARSWPAKPSVRANAGVLGALGGPGALLALAVLLAQALAAGRARAADDAGTQGPFTLGAGARGLGMGRTGVALSDDATTVFWNPARLATVESCELALFRTKLFTDGLYYHAGFLTYPTLDLGTFGVGYQRLDASDIERRSDRNELLGSFNDAESNLLVGYGRGVGHDAALGLVLKLAQQSLDGRSDLGVGVDAGVSAERALGRDGLHRVFAGANVQNLVEPSLRLDQEDVQEPRSFKLGLGYKAQASHGALAVAAAVDLDLPSTADPRLGLGAECTLYRMLALRAGSDGGRLTLGFGLEYSGIRLDYAMRSDSELPRNDRFTLAARFGAPVSQRRALRQQQREREVSDRLAQLLGERERQERERTQADADAAFDDGRFDEAQRLYRRLLALDPESAHARERIDQAQLQSALAAAAAQLAMGEAAQAAAAFQAILDRWPDGGPARSGLTRAHALLQASADQQAQLATLLQEAMVRFADGDPSTAQSLLEELLRADPGHELARSLLERVRAARAAAGQKELERAKAEAAARQREQQERARQLAQQPGPQARPRVANLSPESRRRLERLYQDGMTAFSAEDFDRAIRLWREVWAEAPEFESVGEHLVKAYLLQGITLYSQGDYERAIERCRHVLEIDPGNEKARRYLDRIQEEKVELEHIGGR